MTAYDDQIETEIKRHTNWKPNNWYEYYYFNIDAPCLPDNVRTKEEALEALDRIADYYAKAYCDIQDMPDDDWEEE